MYLRWVQLAHYTRCLLYLNEWFDTVILFIKKIHLKQNEKKLAQEKKEL